MIRETISNRGRAMRPLWAGLCVGAATAALVLLPGCGSGSSSSVTSAGGGGSRRASTKPTSSPERSATSRTSRVSLPDLIEQTRSGVVQINVNGCGFEGTGTGVLVGPHEVVTVEHVVDAATSIRIARNGKTLGKAVVIGADGARDLALLKTNTAISGHRFQISTTTPRLGDSVAAIGYPLGLPLSVTKGTVSGLGRMIPIHRVKRRGLIQTDAAVNPGNSGGPVLLLPAGR
jgi:serine protease Do